MKLVKPSYEIIEQTPGMDGIYKAIELTGKVSHKSEGNIKEGSAKKFVDNMIKLGHNATLEFGTIYLDMSYGLLDQINETESGHSVQDYIKNPYSKVVKRFKGIIYHYYITTNYRTLLENNWLDDLKYLCEPTEYHEKRYCVKFTCDRGVSHEFVRHRTMSFMQESTRWCNYSNGRFNNEITYIIPIWINKEDVDNFNIFTTQDGSSLNIFMNSLANAESDYFLLLEDGWKPQQARQVLPNALKTELYMCGFASDWEKFFALRDDKAHAHPDAYALAHPLHQEFIKRNYL